MARALGTAFDRHGFPEHLLTDRGPVFRAPPVAELLDVRGDRHVLTLPAHSWTNGRIERAFPLQGDRLRPLLAHRQPWPASALLRRLPALAQPRTASWQLGRAHARRGLLRAPHPTSATRPGLLLRRRPPLGPLRLTIRVGDDAPTGACSFTSSAVNARSAKGLVRATAVARSERGAYPGPWGAARGAWAVQNAVWFFGSPTRSARAHFIVDALGSCPWWVSAQSRKLRARERPPLERCARHRIRGSAQADGRPPALGKANATPRRDSARRELRAPARFGGHHASGVCRGASLGTARRSRGRRRAAPRLRCRWRRLLPAKSRR